MFRRGFGPILLKKKNNISSIFLSRRLLGELGKLHAEMVEAPKIWKGYYY